MIAILTEEKDLQTANSTHAELVERLAEMEKPSKILRMIMHRTSQPQSTVSLDLNQIRQDDLIDIEGRLGIGFDGEDDTETSGELEDVVLITDGDDANGESAVEVPWKELAKTFLALLITYTLKKETITCPECQADEACTTEESKTKEHKKQHVNRHLAGSFTVVEKSSSEE